MNTADARVMLVGSLPFGDAEETFRAAGRSLNGYIGWIPDGEFGERKLWTPMLPEFVYSKEPDLEETLAPPNRTVVAPPAIDGPPPADMAGFWNFRIKRGRLLRFDDLLYGRFAVDSYGVFRRLREEGVIPSDVRFQVSLPSPHSGDRPVLRGRRSVAGGTRRVSGRDEARDREDPGGGSGARSRLPMGLRQRDRRPRHGGGERHEVVSEADRRGEVRASRRPAGPARRRDPRGSPARLSLVLWHVGRLARLWPWRTSGSASSSQTRRCGA